MLLASPEMHALLAEQRFPGGTMSRVRGCGVRLLKWGKADLTIAGTTLRGKCETEDDEHANPTP